VKETDSKHYSTPLHSEDCHLRKYISKLHVTKYGGIRYQVW